MDYSTVVQYMGEKEQGGCRLRLWDHAGQNVFAPAQHLMYPNNGAVAHVMNLMSLVENEAEALTELEARLSTTALHSRQNVLMLCFTHLDDFENCMSAAAGRTWLDELSVRLDEHFAKTHERLWLHLHRDIDSNRCFFVVDNTQINAGAERLRRAVDLVIEEDKFGYINKKIPFRWIQVLDAVQQLAVVSETVLTFKQVEQIAASFGVPTAAKVKAMLATLNDIGNA